MAANVIQPEEKAVFFEHRFTLAGRGHPAVDTAFQLASEWMERGDIIVGVPKASKTVTPVQLDPIDIVQMEVRLPPMPAVLLELQEVIQRRHASADMIGQVIAKDPGLTAWLLKLVNSPYYGFSAKIATIPRAVALVGTRQLQTLALGGALNSLAVLLPKETINMDKFWRHSIATGVAAQEIWKLSGRQDPEQLFVSGLLHDCGKLAMAYAAPNIAAVLHQAFSAQSKPGYMEEKELIGFDHARLGGMLLHRWNMPLPLVMAVLRHHNVEDPVRYPEAAAVHVADFLATALDIALDNNMMVPPLSIQAWDVLGLAPEKLALVADTLQAKVDGLCDSLRGKA